MAKKAIIFLDYNDTFDDVGYEKGNVFISSLKRFVKHFGGNVKIVVITSALPFSENSSIKSDLSYTLSYFPPEIKNKFKFLIEENCKYFTEIYSTDRIHFGQTCKLSDKCGSKKDGVEIFLKTFDKQNEISTCVFVGDSENADLPMLNADIGNRQKFCILANRRILKASTYPVYRLSMQPQEGKFDYAKDIFQSVEKEQALKSLVIKTSNKSYGAGKGLEVVTCLLESEGKEL